MSAQLTEMIDVAAQLGALGLDPMKFLSTRDETERRSEEHTSELQSP